MSRSNRFIQRVSDDATDGGRPVLMKPRIQRVLQFFYDPEPRMVDLDSSIWLLGAEYRPRDSPLAPNGGVAETPEWPPAFLCDFESRIRCTYRTGCVAIPFDGRKQKGPGQAILTRLGMGGGTDTPEGFVSDTGWGCMIRTGQCLLANALLLVRFGRSWRWSLSLEHSAMLNDFADNPKAPFSIHKFVEHGSDACGKQPGEWFGPSAAASCIQALVKKARLNDLTVYISDAGDVYDDEFHRLSIESAQKFRPVLLLCAVRLGVDGVNPIYSKFLKECLRLPQAVGIAGGRPSSSHYFVAFQNEDFFYLDPHQPQTAVPFKEPPEILTSEEVASFHSRRLHSLAIKDMDPSMLIGFLIRSENEWQEWKVRLSSFAQKDRFIHVSPTAPRQATGKEGEVEALSDSDEI